MASTNNHTGMHLAPFKNGGKNVWIKNRVVAPVASPAANVTYNGRFGAVNPENAKTVERLEAHQATGASLRKSRKNKKSRKSAKKASRKSSKKASRKSSKKSRNSRK